MKERMINLQIGIRWRQKSKGRLLILLLTVALLLPTRVQAGFALPTDTEEVGVYKLEKADLEPDKFDLVEHEADLTYETQLSAIEYCTA